MSTGGDIGDPVGYGAASTRFRQQVRDWLADNAPDELRGVRVPRKPDDELRARLGRWADVLTDAGLMCVSWPEEYGGRGLSGLEVAILNEEFDRAEVPRLTRGMGEALVGPALIAHGTDEQRARFLPPIIRGEHVYCQGFSEPEAGSDLAGLVTQGIVEGDELVINGQKVWTSQYDVANMIFVLCRTDPSAPKHRGISYVLVPLEIEGRSNGVEFRPIKRMTGESTHFAETFLNDAHAPLDNVVGGLNNGWRVAMTTLGSERGGRATTQHIGHARKFWELVGQLEETGLLDDPTVRERLAWAYSEIEMLRHTGVEMLAALAAGTDADGASNGSSNKIRWSEFQQGFDELAMELTGPASLVVGEGYQLDRWQDEFLSGRSHTIWGGTAEVQRNIIAERVLGMPKEPRPQPQQGARA